jgi:hypothetical protein
MRYKCLAGSGIVLLALLGFVGQVAADAKDDCRIEFQNNGDNNLVYVKNTNPNRRVRVTVSTTEISLKGGNRRLPDKTFSLSAGERAFCGSDRSGDCTYVYAVLGATYE